MTAVRQLDDDIGTVRAGICAVFANRVAVDAAAAFAASACGAMEGRLLGNGLCLGDVSCFGNLIGMCFTDDDLGKLRCVGNAFNDGRRAAGRVACGIDAGNVRLECGTALGVNFNAVGLQALGIDLFADGGDDQIAGDLHGLAGSDGTAAAGSIGLAQLHDVQQQLAVGLLHRSGQLDKVDAFVNGQLQLMLVSGHVLLRTAVDDGGTGAHALCNAGSVHRGVASADNDDIAAQTRLDLALHFLHPADDACDIAFNAQLASLPSADCEQDVGITHALELVNGGGRSAQLDFDAVLHHQSDVLVDGFVRDTECGDDVTRHAAQLVLTLKDRGRDTGAAQEVSGCNTGRAAADDGDFLASDGSGLADGGHQRVVALLGGFQLRVTDLDRFFIEIPGALVLAAMCADGAGDERQRVLFRDELQGRTIQALAAQLDVFGDVLLDGAAALTGSRETVDQGNLLVGLALRHRLDGLGVMPVGVAGGAQIRDGSSVGAGKCLEGHAFDLFAHLDEAVVSAGLQDGGRHGDGPNACCEDLVAVESVSAAGEGDPHLALKLTGNAVAHLDGQREQGTAGHVHFVVGQLAAGGVDREGVGELQAKFQTLAVCQCLQTLEHRDSVGPLQVFVEVMIVEDDVVIAHGVQNGAGGLVTQDGGVALNKGVQALFLDQVRSDALDLLGRTAVQGGDGDGTGDVRADRSDVILLFREHLGQDGKTFLKLLGIGGVLHVVDVAVDLRALDAFVIVANGHVKDEAVRIAEAEFLADELQSAPSLDVFVLRLGDRQLRGPFLVVAFVLRPDAGTRNTCGQLFAIHLLTGLELEEASACHVSGDDVLRQLAVGACCRAERGLDLFAEDGQRFATGIVSFMDAEDLALGGVFGGDPVHQFVEGDRVHSFRHLNSSWCCVAFAFASRAGDGGQSAAGCAPVFLFSPMLLCRRAATRTLPPGSRIVLQQLQRQN